MKRFHFSKRRILLTLLLTLSPSIFSFEKKLIEAVEDSLWESQECSADDNNSNFEARSSSSKLLPGSYDKYVYPGTDDGNALNLTFYIYIQDISSLHEESLEYRMDCFLVVWWKDRRLTWPKEWANKTIVRLDPGYADLIWIPDVYITNSRKALIHKVLKQAGSVRISPDKTVRYSTRLSLVIGCDMNLMFYPMDTQNCVIVLESYGYLTKHAHFKWKDPGLEILKDLNVPQFAISVTHGKSSEGLYGSAGSYPRLNATVRFQRTMRYHIMQTFIPSTIYVVMSWISYCIDPRQLPARTVLTVTTVLTVSNQYSSLRESLPPVSYIKAIDIWMLACFVFVIASLLEFGLVIAILRWSKCDFEDLLSTGSSDQMFKDQMSVASLSPEMENRKVWNHKSAEREALAWKIEKVCRILIPCLFICFSAFYWPYHMIMAGRW